MIVNSMRSITFDAPTAARLLCSEVLSHQAWLWTRVLTRANGGNCSFIEVLTSEMPDLSKLPKWDQHVTVRVKTKIFGARKEREHGMFLGYDKNTSGASLASPSSSHP